MTTQAHLREINGLLAILTTFVHTRSAKYSEGMRLLQVVQLGKKLLILLNACCRFLRRPVGRVCDTFCTDM